MKTLHMLADVYGPRVTGSPNLKAAGEWAIKQMQSWGFSNGHLEPWDFGHPGWVNERFSAHITAPVKDQLTCEVLAWTPGTDGTGDRAGLSAGDAGRPTPAELTAFLESEKAKVKGRIVLVGKHTLVPVNINPAGQAAAAMKRCARSTIRTTRTAAAAAAGAGRSAGAADDRAADRRAGRRVPRRQRRKVRVNDAAREHGQIIAFNNRTYDVAKAVPTVVMRNEDYGRISRILADGTPVELEFNIVNKIYPEGRTAYNTIAEIPGTDKKDEIVMLGGHLDSWQSATGATDNAIGCATMMEAARILKAIGVTPRRTIRVALWSGEEEGHPRLAGLREGAFRHLREPEAAGVLEARWPISTSTPAPAARAAPASSARRPRRPSCARRSRRSRISASPARRRRPAATIAGTDSTAFNNVGLPGIGFGQDPIEYNTHTHHTNLDNYERVIEDDVKASAIAIAATLYQLAMRDEMLPRLPAAQMPPLPTPARP